MPLSLVISPHGHLLVEDLATESEARLPPVVEQRIQKASEGGAAHLLLHLGSEELQSDLPGGFSFVRDLSREYLTRLCHMPGLDGAGEIAPVPPPAEADLEAMVFRAPPMCGLEYLTADVLGRWWAELDEYVRGQIRSFPGSPQEYLRGKNPLWRLVGRVTFHLAENKRDEANPFAFLATYSSRLSAKGRLQHLPLKNALQEYAGAKHKEALLSLLQPIQRAAEKSPLARDLVDSGAVYHPLAWTAREAYGFLREIPLFEESGIVVRVPDWWKPKNPPRPQVSVRIGDKAKSKLGAEALLDFSVGVTLDGEPLSDEEIRAILASSGGLVPLRGRWVEVDRVKLQDALAHWKKVEREARGGGISFFEGMRLLAGAPVGDDQAAAAPPETRDWTGILPGQWLDQTLAELRDPTRLGPATPQDLHAELRPYQQLGVNWLRFLTRLGLGACLADDMGLGKTIQVISLLLHLRPLSASGDGTRLSSLLVVPASLLANWKSEIARFAPTLQFRIVHPSEEKNSSRPYFSPEINRDGSYFSSDGAVDLVITSYGMLTRTTQLREPQWNLVILDEAQAIKNSGTRQTRAVKELKASARIALTGTPVENRLSDLWS